MSWDWSSWIWAVAAKA